MTEAATHSAGLVGLRGGLSSGSPGTIEIVETIHLKRKAAKGANDKPKHGDNAAQDCEKMQLGISKRRAKAGKRKEIPPSTSRPVQPGKPPNLPVFIAPSPISTLSLQTTTPIFLQQPSAIPVVHPSSPIPFQIRQCRSPSNPIAIVILARGRALATSVLRHTSKVVAKSLRAEPRPIVCRRPARRRCCPGLGGETRTKAQRSRKKKAGCRIQGVCLANR